MGLESLALSVGRDIAKAAVKNEGALTNVAKSLGKSVGKSVLKSVDKHFQSQLNRAQARQQTVSVPSLGRSAHSVSQGRLPAKNPTVQNTQQALTLGRVDTKKALSAFRSFDANLDGNVSREELKQGLDGLNKQIANLKSGAGQNSSIQNEASLQDAEQLYALGHLTLNNYDSVASQDGVDGSLTSRDLLALANHDNRANNISFQDWNHTFRS